MKLCSGVFWIFLDYLRKFVNWFEFLKTVIFGKLKIFIMLLTRKAFDVIECYRLKLMNVPQKSHFLKKFEKFSKFQKK